MKSDTFSKSEIARLHQQLRKWYRANARSLPWRVTRDAYPIWVSEVMLQQTQVAAVIPYFQRFLEKFPSIHDLALATEQDVLRCWEGLGYYRRARHLHSAAQRIVRDHQGQFPNDPELVRSLPGMGRYTSGAILSQAFNQRLPAVDANIARLLIRLRAWKFPIAEKRTQAWLWNTAESFLPRKFIGDYHQSLMELGQLICLPRSPRCSLCPLQEICRARKDGIADELPIRGAKTETTATTESALLVHRQGKVLVCQRQQHANRWAGMWEFPTLATAKRSNKKLLDSFVSLLGILITSPAKLGSISYGITRFRVELRVFAASYQSGRVRSNQYQRCAWMRGQDLSALPFSVPQRRLASLFLDTPAPSRDE